MPVFMGVFNTDIAFRNATFCILQYAINAKRNNKYISPFISIT